jgi:hypothetical protein
MQMKAQTDLANVSNPVQAFKDMAISWGMPDYSATLSGVGNNYTAPCDGIFWFTVPNYNTTLNVHITPLSSTEITYTQVINSYGSPGGYQVVLAKGDRITIHDSTISLAYSYFIPLKGADK